MTDTVDFSDESLDRSILRRADYDDTDPKDLVLTIPKRDGGKISVPLLKHARSNIERDDYQENTLLRIKPLAEIADNLPVHQSIRVKGWHCYALDFSTFFAKTSSGENWRSIKTPNLVMLIFRKRVRRSTTLSPI